MRIAVFGGTFNPPHPGHIKLAAAVISNKLADKILFVPAYRPPHKSDWELASFEDRLAMMKLAAEALPESEVSDIEEYRPEEPSYTEVTMNALATASPSDHFVLLIGEDSLLQLHSWYSAQKLVENWEILSYPRPPLNVTLDNLKDQWLDELAEKLFRSKVELPVFDISSTEIRHALKHNLSISGMLDDKVAHYIEEKSLYR